ncbi:MAG: nuclear transport factor 2 family protein [Verrucomicrobiales bacterium]|nr:nuclear transport factor 2 family protein [Verrucomicrobiales bacterium]
MKRATPYFGAAILALMAIWWWRDTLFPGEEVRIRKSIESLAGLVSFESNEGGLAAGRRISAAVARFAPGAEIQLEILGAGSFHLTGGGEVQQTLWAARRGAQHLRVRFFDILATVSPDGRSAEARLTATAEARGNRSQQEGFEAMEFRLQLQKVDGAWQITRVETVQALTQ